MKVVLATHNAHKVEEFQGILGRALPELEIVAYDGPDPVEDGTSFDENALIKARVAAAHTGLPTLADDSGICVDVLGGAPGIFSALWAGHGKGAVANLELLLDQLADIAPEHRAASFACHIAIVNPASGFETVVSGTWPGRLATEVHGEGGFGYDPIFVPEGHDITAAELTAEQKNAISHRARAFEAAIPVLRMNVIPD
ncbi:RdgB/HAM1 family non-canonical purine NTP pyrophosphatase [Herbiconiux sp. KACC 21604]|uniref:RdgB/HAM1 family non-canonical purine NTP pyrophosphatase n=1 Tax=unclassified Herbiconiux TaxID=2618217 RepID=UPI001490A51E|nr:RdgB/HAM1 family non-canonical purine NTP pyrophosphatase [Herbiconiux sp. SALV-R1]QJU53842.1 RdgB/HAM1 family non-canonical purine NTP pyrophosphatase [Herbiconiux sp. SALV-R1]WPO84854.1 RdgB/HAM1 family non-canonical purine NTP pyrophosphatase [Herbiconiux sp. KACC 21604]